MIFWVKWSQAGLKSLSSRTELPFLLQLQNLCIHTLVQFRLKAVLQVTKALMFCFSKYENQHAQTKYFYIAESQNTLLPYHLIKGKFYAHTHAYIYPYIYSHIYIHIFWHFFLPYFIQIKTFPKNIFLLVKLQWKTSQDVTVWCGCFQELSWNESWWSS